MQNKRYLADIIEQSSLKYHKMAFVSGPRQVGKTTMAKAILRDRKTGEYSTWDDKSFRKLWVKGPKHVAASVLGNDRKDTIRPILILDELHKDKKWKSSLKGLYDLYHEDIDMIVIGSARLNVFKRGGDSLMGRYFSFRLHPLSLAELLERRADDPLDAIDRVFVQSVKPKNSAKMFERLIEFGGFPDPYFNQDSKFSNLWRAGRLEKLIREDLRDLSRLPELSQVELMATLLPEKVGSPFSIQSLREDIEVSHDTIKRWMNYLESLYYHFTIRPYSKRMPRALEKEPKIYLYDWTEIDDVGSRFENLIASHLLKACEYWTDSGHGRWSQNYLRNKEKQEVDFLLTHKEKPILSIQCKYGDTTFDPSILAFARHLGIKRHIQIVGTKAIWKRVQIDGLEVLIASAEAV